jgi:hypothetical protein
MEEMPNLCFIEMIGARCCKDEEKAREMLLLLPIQPVGWTCSACAAGHPSNFRGSMMQLDSFDPWLLGLGSGWG